MKKIDICFSDMTGLLIDHLTDEQATSLFNRLKEDIPEYTTQISFVHPNRSIKEFYQIDITKVRMIKVK